MKREMVVTNDGSHSITIPEMNVMYHSHYGAIQESLHVFIEVGLRQWLGVNNNRPIRILEMGLGTGLNVLLTYAEAAMAKTSINYTAVELYPLPVEDTLQLNYCDQLKRDDLKIIFSKIHSCEWGIDIELSSFFSLHKINKSLHDVSLSHPIDLIYFDAFAPTAQPDLWTQQLFEKLFIQMARNAVLVTYCSKGDVRRALQAAGFIVEKLKGPPGKREMLRATKHS